MIELTEAQQESLEAQGENPPRVVNPRTKEAFVLVRADLYEQIKELLEDAEDQATQKAWLDMATKTRRRLAQENPY